VTNSVAMSQLFGIALGTDSVAILQLFGISFRTASVAILHSFGMDQASSTCPPAGAFVGLLDVHRMLGEHIILNRGVRLLALLGGACRSNCRCACHHLTRLTYRRSLSPLVDSCRGVLSVR